MTFGNVFCIFFSRCYKSTGSVIYNFFYQKEISIFTDLIKLGFYNLTLFPVVFFICSSKSSFNYLHYPLFRDALFFRNLHYRTSEFSKTAREASTFFLNFIYRYYFFSCHNFWLHNYVNIFGP